MKSLGSQHFRMPWKKLTGALSVAVTMSVAQPGGAEEAKTLRFAEIAELPTLSLHEEGGGALAISFVPQSIYEPLLRVDEQMQLQPGLAVSWEQTDEATYRIVLREGVYFHSGNPLTAQAVKDYFDWQTGPDSAAAVNAYLKRIEEMTVRDELTLDIRLDKPYGPFLHFLSLPHTAVSDIRHFETVGREAFGAQPSGTGPFMLERWELGSELVVKANPNYWDGEPGVDRIQFRFMPDATARSLALESGEIDISEAVAPADVARLDAHPDINVANQYESRSVVWFVNPQHPILSDINVRKALAHSIDFRLLIDSLLGDVARPLLGYLPEGTFGFTKLEYEHDPDLAAQLLADSGWEKNAEGFYTKDGKPLELTHVTGRYQAAELQFAEGAQSLLREFGIDLKIEVIELAVHTTKMMGYARNLSSTPDFATTGWDQGVRTGEASVLLDPMLTCGSPFNFVQYCSDEYADLIAQGVSGASESQRLKAFQTAQELLHDEVVVLPLWQPRLTFASHSRVGNVNLTSTRTMHMGRLTLD